ncbi:acyl carrier protein phosphodiesterase [Flammeovirga aprica]|uniref:DUF479 domain-containing protein n=1 Tax=Flammeovirga aprica JL-4 TaxID=694437 RepID=A0A7X9P146_9BACT|nr:ACP phosphodiesterase [Flammeovirga aprica]NME67598.1 DUF479 domain-containing protein [Flammeovirga aprica JL-4]
MNYLAHLYLSYADTEEMFGNFIGDFVKGKNLSSYPEKIQKGIRLHRFIDDFTDRHPVTKEMSNKLKPHAGRFSMVVTDIYHDHFLAQNWDNCHQQSLREFADSFYQHQLWNEKWVPEKAMNMYPYLKLYDWLNAYQHFGELEKVFFGMERRIKNLAPISKSVEWLQNDYNFFLDCHQAFFPELEQKVEEFRQNAFD